MSRQSILVAVMLVLLAGLQGPSPALGDCSERWVQQDGIPGLSYSVTATAVYDDGTGPALYAGGGFAFGSSSRGIAKWKGVAPVPGQPDSNWIPLGSGISDYGCVYALTVFNGELIAGGPFTTVDGVSCSNIAKWDGLSWTPLGSGVRDGGEGPIVNALAVFNGELIAGGFFTEAGGMPCTGIAKWDGSNWAPLGGGVSSGLGWPGVYALAVVNGELIAGGYFTNSGDAACSNIAKWNGTSWVPLGAGMDRSVQCLTILNGDLIAGGYFTTAGGVTCNGIARWNGSSWTPLSSGVGGVYNAYVHALTVFNGELIAGGHFTTVGGVPRKNIARWDGLSWAPLGSAMDNSSSVYALTVFNGKLIAGGDFTTADGAPGDYVAQWNGLVWGTGVGGTVYAETVFNGELIAGGSFGTAGDVTCNSIAKWDGSSWVPLGGGVDGSGSIYALTVFDGELIAGGMFTNIGGGTCNRIAKWDGSSWAPLGSGMNSDVKALTVFNGELIAGGTFSTAGGVTCNGIAKWDGSSWVPLGSGMYGPVYALAVLDGELIAGGSFWKAGGVICNNIAKWDGSSWAALGSGMNDGVDALTVFNGELIAGGTFGLAGGVPCSCIASWNPGTPGTWAPLGTGMGGAYPPEVHAMTVFNGKLITGGYFTTAGGVVCRFIASWSPVTPGSWVPLGSGIGLSSFASVYALTVFDGELIAGGNFYSAGGVASKNWARWSPLWGDANSDEAVNEADIVPFVLALVDPDAYDAQFPGCLPTCDVNRDAAVDGLDVQAFVELLLSP